MTLRYCIANRFNIVHEAIQKDSVYRHLQNEYKDYLTDDCSQVPTIGYVKEFCSDIIPLQYRELVKGLLYEDESYLYFKSNNKFIRINLNNDFFEISYTAGVDEGTVFHLMEVATRIYAHKYGIDFFHASAFEYNNQVYMLNGFGGSGKTEIMVNALFKGASYISDDLVIINENAEIFPYTVSIPIRWGAINMPFVRRVKVSPRIYNICKYCAQKNGRITRRIYGRLAWKHLLGDYSHSKLTDARTDMHFYTVNHCFWIQTSLKDDRFSFSNEEFYRYMNLCLENESRKYADLEGFFNLKFPQISILKRNREELRKEICAKLHIQAIGIAERDYEKIANNLLLSK